MMLTSESDRHPRNAAASSFDKGITGLPASDQQAENVEAAGINPDARILIYFPKQTTSLLFIFFQFHVLVSRSFFIFQTLKPVLLCL